MDNEDRWAHPQAAPTGTTVTRAISWMAGAQVLAQGTWLASLVVLGALLPPSSFGTVTTGIVLVTVATRLMGAGTAGSIVSTPNIGPREARRALLVNVAGGIVLTAVVVAAAGPVTRTFARGGDADVLRVLASSIVLYSLTIVPGALLQKRMRFKLYASATAIATLVSSVTAVASAVMGAGVWALVIRQVLYHAVLAGLTWWMARDLLPRLRRWSPDAEYSSAGRRGGRWFLLLSTADLVAFNADYLVVGWLTDASQLGLYSLAFTLSFAPLRHFAWQVGGVFFAASAAVQDPERTGRQMIRALRMTGVLLLPIVPPALTLAPWLLPGVLGDVWSDMVVPFQILLLVGVGHALLNVMGEFLAGTGSVEFRARVSVAWATGMIGALLLLVPAYGIGGAAAAHAVAFVAVAAAYGVGGSRRLGLHASAVARSLGGVILPVVAQTLTTTMLLLTMLAAGFHTHTSQAAAAIAGLGVVTVLWLRTEPSPLKEAITIAAGALTRSGGRRVK
ncbi:MAG TPA: oligosaccharide flippase family protein [Chloroflexota bacterium]|nr:oligosaccharide flippase family protein [Chloroflexota bacterium]